MLAGQNFEGLPKTKTAGEFGPSVVKQKVPKFLALLKTPLILSGPHQGN